MIIERLTRIRFCVSCFTEGRVGEIRVLVSRGVYGLLVGIRVRGRRWDEEGLERIVG